MNDAPPRLFDRALHRLRLDRAAPDYARGGFLKTRVAEETADRLSAILHQFPLALDLGARDGAFARALVGTPAEARIGALIEADLSEKMLRSNPAANSPRMSLVADEERLPFAAESLDLVVSLLSLHWADDLPGVLVQIRRALKPDGLFMGSFFGGATLTELRQSLLAAEAELIGGAGLRVSPFADGLDAAGLLQRAGFALPVADGETIDVEYESALALMHDLGAMGEGNLVLERRRGMARRATLLRAAEIYNERFTGASGRVMASFEVLFLHGWAPHASQPKPLKPGSAALRLAEALDTAERSAGEKVERS
jgi:SAM-dependent methyltransferase